MYRLIYARAINNNKLNNIQLSPLYSKLTSNQEFKCSFCQKAILNLSKKENTSSSRHQSTRVALIVAKHLQKKRKLKKPKNYGEVLEVGPQVMSESKVSISQLHADHISKLVTSPVSLNNLYKLAKEKAPHEFATSKIEAEMLLAAKEIILNVKYDDSILIYSNKKIQSLEENLKRKDIIDSLKISYYSYRNSTIYYQRLKDLRSAINEGMCQEFQSQKLNDISMVDDVPKGAHAVFRELFVDNNNILSDITHLKTSGVPDSVLEEILEEDSLLHNETAECDLNLVEDEHSALSDDINYEHNIQSLKDKKEESTTFKTKKSKKAKKKMLLEKRLLQQDLNVKSNLKDMEVLAKLELKQKKLSSHLEVLCSLNMINEAKQIIKYYRHVKKQNQNATKVINVNLYNILLHGLASTGNYDDSKQLFNDLINDELTPNPQSFAAIFESIEKSDLRGKSSLLNEYRMKLEKYNITLNDLLDKSKFIYDQRESVLKAIRLLEPNFVPKYTKIGIDYNCPLMEDLTLKHPNNRSGLFVSPIQNLLSVEELKEKGRKQMQLELDGEVVVKNINVKDENTPEVKHYRKILDDVMSEWRVTVKEAFSRNLSTCRLQNIASRSTVTLYPYLNTLKEEQFVDLIIGEISKIVGGSESYSPMLSMLQRDLGMKVYLKFQIEQYRLDGRFEKLQKIYDEYCEWYAKRNTEEPLNCRQAWQEILHRHNDGASMDFENNLWSADILQNIGKFLYNIIINDLKININIFKNNKKVKKLPALYMVHRSYGRRVLLEVKPHPVMMRLWSIASPSELMMRSALLPSCGPPEPWHNQYKGAYLVTPTDLIRMPYFVLNHANLIKNTPTSSFYPSLDSINQLGEVPWVINKPILDLQLKIFRSGGNKKLDIAPPSTALDTSAFGNSKEKTEIYKRKLAISRARADLHSLWCDALYKLSLANHYRDQIFWLPHNMDFRGRVYACPPHLSQLGADTARSLLKFAVGRPLGAEGLNWLKLHLVNLVGTKKKCTIEERLAYINETLDLIIDSANDPLGGEGWWMTAEEPWQALACCMEINNAISSGNPEEYVCSFPVHQDGSCNGLQHYAALGGDTAGAHAVNLSDAPAPSDVYSAVAVLVEKSRKEDAKNGVVIAQKLEGFVQRKVIKQTVMTTVYGVTKYGARLQIAKRLKEIDDFPKNHVWAASVYLTEKTFASLTEMFTSTKLIQDWFTSCAKSISSVCGMAVTWVTPLGLPVLQPYYRRSTASKSTKTPTSFYQRPCMVKQRNAFPPNFIHSLDSTHMMLTSLKCQAAGINFISVHDCFWTHPDTVTAMNKICREEFVALHSQPILNDLSNYLQETYSYPESELQGYDVQATAKQSVNSLLKQVPAKGDFNLKSVLKSIYFFS